MNFWIILSLLIIIPILIGVAAGKFSTTQIQKGGLKALKNLGLDMNMNAMIGLFTIFVLLWVLVYAIPGLFHSIFNTTLGNIILLLGVIIAFMKNISTGIVVLIGLLLFKSLASSMHIEAFTRNSKKTMDDEKKKESDKKKKETDKKETDKKETDKKKKETDKK